MTTALQGWEVVARVAEEEIGEWLAVTRARGYREPVERALVWRFRASRLAIPSFDRSYVQQIFAEDGWLARRIEAPLFQRVLELDPTEPGYALEWIEAVPLRRALRGPVSHALALGVASVLAEAAAVLHEQRANDGTPLSMLARCLDLDSVWVTPDGEIRAANPVIVRSFAFRAGDGRSRPELFDCMPPEAVRGEPSRVESDVYQIALLFFALCIGRSPYLHATPFETLDSVRRAELDMNELDAVPSPLRAVLMRALEREPTKRPADARELATQLVHAAGASSIGIAEPGAGFAELVRGLAPEVCGLRRDIVLAMRLHDVSS